MFCSAKYPPLRERGRRYTYKRLFFISPISVTGTGGSQQVWRCVCRYSEGLSSRRIRNVHGRDREKNFSFSQFFYIFFHEKLWKISRETFSLSYTARVCAKRVSEREMKKREKDIRNEAKKRRHKSREKTRGEPERGSRESTLGADKRVSVSSVTLLIRAVRSQR